jgi:hypothetical protein
MEEKTNREIARTEIVDHLALIGRAQDHRRLELDSNATFDEEVQSKVAHRHPAVDDFERRFLDDGHVSIPELGCQRSTVDRLEIAESQRRVALIECADDLTRELALDELQSIRPLSRHPVRSALLP